MVVPASYLRTGEQRQEPASLVKPGRPGFNERPCLKKSGKWLGRVSQQAEALAQAKDPTSIPRACIKPSTAEHTCSPSDPLGGGPYNLLYTATDNRETLCEMRWKLRTNTSAEVVL